MYARVRRSGWDISDPFSGMRFVDVSLARNVAELEFSDTFAAVDKSRDLEASLRIAAVGSSVRGRFVLKQLEVEGVRSALNLDGVSEAFRMELTESTQDGVAGGRDTTEVVATRSEVQRLCALGELSVVAREGSSIGLRPTCESSSVSLDVDSSSRVE
ncbi:MAG: hypothetical protein AAGD10_07350 [Myxococcota bacterium]